MSNGAQGGMQNATGTEMVAPVEGLYTVTGTMPVTNRLSSAFDLAVQLHGEQVRKGTGVFYITHLMAVSSLVGEYGGSEDLMIAALLHDSLEDRPDQIRASDIEKQFGPLVAHVVVGCSDCQCKPKPSWEQRRRLMVERLRTADSNIKLVAAADKLHNASSLLRDARYIGESHWERFNAPKDRQLWYLRACHEALCEGWENLILHRLNEVVESLERL